MKLLYLFCISTFFLNACSVLVGQVKPVDEKAKKLPFREVSLIDPNWHKLEITSQNQNAEDSPDAAWQSTLTAAVISLNSACRQSFDESSDLKEVTQSLLSQWRGLKIESEQATTLSGFPAWETKARGMYLKSERKFETVVVKTPTCVYDLIYLSPVKTFDQELSVFSQFRDNLNLK